MCYSWSFWRISNQNKYVWNHNISSRIDYIGYNLNRRNISSFMDNETNKTRLYIMKKQNVFIAGVSHYRTCDGWLLPLWFMLDVSSATTALNTRTVQVLSRQGPLDVVKWAGNVFGISWHFSHRNCNRLSYNLTEQASTPFKPLYCFFCQVFIWYSI